jgi:hypothetical protein
MLCVGVLSSLPREAHARPFQARRKMRGPLLGLSRLGRALLSLGLNLDLAAMVFI